MNKSLATFGILAVTGVLSLCDLCGSPARVAMRAAAAHPAAVMAPVPAAVPTQRQVTAIRVVRYTATRPR